MKTYGYVQIAIDAAITCAVVMALLLAFGCKKKGFAATPPPMERGQCVTTITGYSGDIPKGDSTCKWQGYEWTCSPDYLGTYECNRRNPIPAEHSNVSEILK